MRWVPLLVVAGCSFTPGAAGSDATTDVRIDTPDATPTWVVDSTSKKACPANAAQWSDFLAAHGLAMAPPNSVWTMQDAASPLADAIGTVDLTQHGTDQPVYGMPVAGWTRVAIATSDDNDVSYYNITDPGLPDMGASSMLILLYYATVQSPAQTRSVLFGGAGNPPMIAQIDLDPSNHFILTAANTSATGTIDHGVGVIPLVLRIDRAHSEQHLIVDHEVIAPMYIPLASSRGILLAGANNRAPAGRWLYMAAWYGSRAEIADAEASTLLTALGW